MYLQLADNGQDQWMDSLAEESPQDLYIFVPHDESGETGEWIREDHFDHLSPIEWNAVMDQLEPYQPSAQLSGIFSNFKEKRAARKEGRAQKKFDKREGKSLKKSEKERRKEERHAGRMSSRQSRQEKRLTKGGSGFDMDKGMEIGGNILDTVGGMFGGGGGGDRGFEGGFSYGEEKSWMAKNWPILAVGGVVLIGGAYFLTKKKK
jgi:hypothetical protein